MKVPSNTCKKLALLLGTEVLNQALAATLEAAGWDTCSMPLIETQLTPNLAGLSDAVDQLADYDCAIFVSGKSVEYAWPYIKAVWPRGPLLRWFAMGPASAAALYQRGVRKVEHSVERPYDSVAFLNLPAMKNVQDKRLVLFKGQGGRRLLEMSLRARGATVQVVETHVRRLPAPSVLQAWEAELDTILACEKLDTRVFIASCQTSLEHLLEWLADSPLRREKIQAFPLVVPSRRVQVRAEKLGWPSALIRVAASIRPFDCLQALAL